MGLKEDINEIKGKLMDKEEQEKSKKEKKFKIPFTKRVRKPQNKKGYITKLIIKNNGSIEFNKEQIKKQSILEDGIPRLATPDYVLNYKGNPFLIVPEWSTVPFSPEEHFKKSLDDGSNTKGYAILMERMKLESIKPTKEMGGLVKWILGLGLLGIIGYAFISGGGI